MGTKKSKYIVVDSEVDASNKVLAVTGNLKLYGKKFSSINWKLE
jgi:hypothetical protein